jgi:hypothetical protein
MRHLTALLCVLCVAVASTGCNKKPGSSGGGVGIMNAGEKYGEVMGRAIKKAGSLDSTMYLKNKIVTFHQEKGRYPGSLQELVDTGTIDKLPEPPRGMQFTYDPTSGVVSVK